MLTVRDDLSSYGKKSSRDSQRRLAGYELCFFQIAFLAILITNYELGKWWSSVVGSDSFVCMFPVITLQKKRWLQHEGRHALVPDVSILWSSSTCSWWRLILLFDRSDWKTHFSMALVSVVQGHDYTKVNSGQPSSIQLKSRAADWQRVQYMCFKWLTTTVVWCTIRVSDSIAVEAKKRNRVLRKRGWCA